MASYLHGDPTLYLDLLVLSSLFDGNVTGVRPSTVSGRWKPVHGKVYFRTSALGFANRGLHTPPPHEPMITLLSPLELRRVYGDSQRMVTFPPPDVFSFFGLVCKLPPWQQVKSETSLARCGPVEDIVLPPRPKKSKKCPPILLCLCVPSAWYLNPIVNDPQSTASFPKLFFTGETRPVS